MLRIAGGGEYEVIMENDKIFEYINFIKNDERIKLS